MFAFLLLAAAAQAHGFNELPPEAYLDPVDRQIALTGKGVEGRPAPCARVTGNAGPYKVVASAPTDRCVKMSGPQRFRGLWRNDFEGSQFCVRPAKACKFDTAGDRVWLTVRPEAHPDRKLYAVEFVGRKTIYKGSYGHMGASDHEIIVDRMIRKRVLWAPPPPTKDEIRSMRRQCVERPSCTAAELKYMDEQLKR